MTATISVEVGYSATISVEMSGGASVSVLPPAPPAVVEVSMTASGPPGLDGAMGAPNARRHEWTGTYSYCAQAPNGSAESAEVWTITRLTVAADGSVTSGTATDVAWTDRAIATYT